MDMQYTLNILLQESYIMDIEYVESVSNLNNKNRFELKNYYANLSEEFKVVVHADHMKLLQENRHRRIKGKDGEFHYAMFLLAINKLKTLETISSRKNTEISDIEIERIHRIRTSRIRAMKRKKPSKKADVVKNQFGELVLKLRRENMSWRDISRYIAKYHKTTVSHNYLHQLFGE